MGGMVSPVGGIAGYSKAMQRYRINKSIEQITQIAGNIRTFFAPQKNYVGVYCNGYAYDVIHIARDLPEWVKTIPFWISMAAL